MEPAACAIHGMDKLNAAVGVDVLIIGAGPTGFYFRVPYHFLTWVERLSLTGLILAQLLKLNGAAKVVIAANKGIKTEIAKQLDAGDVYIELDRNDPKEQWDKIKSDYPHGFDIVVRVIYLFVKKKTLMNRPPLPQIEATGSEKVANDAFSFIRRGGTYMIYGVYSDKGETLCCVCLPMIDLPHTIGLARVHWPPYKVCIILFLLDATLNFFIRKIFKDEIRVSTQSVSSFFHHSR